MNCPVQCWNCRSGSVFARAGRQFRHGQRGRRADRYAGALFPQRRPEELRSCHRPVLSRQGRSRAAQPPGWAAARRRAGRAGCLHCRHGGSARWRSAGQCTALSGRGRPNFAAQSGLGIGAPGSVVLDADHYRGHSGAGAVVGQSCGHGWSAASLAGAIRHNLPCVRPRPAGQDQPPAKLGAARLAGAGRAGPGARDEVPSVADRHRGVPAAHAGADRRTHLPRASRSICRAAFRGHWRARPA